MKNYRGECGTLRAYLVRDYQDACYDIEVHDTSTFRLRRNGLRMTGLLDPKSSGKNWPFFVFFRNDDLSFVYCLGHKFTGFIHPVQLYFTPNQFLGRGEVLRSESEGRPSQKKKWCNSIVARVPAREQKSLSG